MAEQQGLITSMRRSRVGFVAIVAAILTLGSLTEALANGKAPSHLTSSAGLEGGARFRARLGLGSPVWLLRGAVFRSQGQRILSLF
jgi:hypothetical protein